jgi:plasmid stabilization system protein ParE
MKLEWSAAALADLERFSEFLRQHYPHLAPIVGREIVAKTRVLEEQPLLGHAITGRSQYRQVTLRVLNAAYVFQYRYDGKSLVMLRVFHGRELRG